ncbi:MAG: bifunctional 2-C-methyl-D-erythritol 4-phosphate cytidylyltransferase/2-C-methyl-D-erythritol 2,4-cyclodiphosphate synthase [Campylobacterota bacterium]|nr:bifunctional 2-C-methyl-D-erythritol 4-phosphate cytidylyltransferase/2-C-methyl-D-erythritol 2,4-cyclodiphosphate synthase [Campylobacterota bacterium]
MSDLTLILLAAGSSSRFEHPVKKQWLRIGHDPLWLFVTNRLNNGGLFNKIIITAHPDEVTFMDTYSDHIVVEGGNSRQESLQNALRLVDSEYVLVTDIARACIDTKLLNTMIEHKEEADCIVPYLPSIDTIVYGDETINRDNVKRIQTPQLSRTTILKKALDTVHEYTDESSAIKASGGTRFFIEGHDDAHKLTYLSDLRKVPCLQPPASATLLGNGFDVHAFEAGKPMVLGGVNIDADFGFKAHSDGDVAIHALIDALLGAAGMGDIGMLFPDSDDIYKNADSKLLLEKTVTLLHRFGYIIVNADVTIAAETPRLAEYKTHMRKVLASLMCIPASRMNVKATTTEKLGFIGRKEGVAVMATATLNYFNWTDK